MDNIIIYTNKYREQVIKLIFDVLEGEFGHQSKSGRPDIQDIPEFYQADQKSNFWVAVNEKEEVIGTIGLSDCKNNKGYVSRLIVKKDERRKGMGKLLLDTLLNFAKSREYEEIYLSTSEDMEAANSFYVKNGFQLIESFPEEVMNRSSWDNKFYKLKLTK